MNRHPSSRPADATPASRDARLWMLAAMAILEIATIKLSFGDLTVPDGLALPDSLVVQLADLPEGP